MGNLPNEGEDQRLTEFGPLEMTSTGFTLHLDGSGTPINAEADGGEEPAVAPAEGAHPDFADVVALFDARAGARDPNPSLDRVEMLLDYLGSPEESFAAIHVAGSNGKTSVARMTESLLRSFNRRTGLFTSPELERITECIEIDGEEISETRFVETWRDIEPYVDMVDAHFVSQGQAPMSRFELLVGMACAAFADAPVEVAVFEVGMGGTWDATNVVDAEVAVITPIGFDHTDFLGDTLPEIAGHKAGIIKPRDPMGSGPAGNIAIVAEQDPEALHVILERTVETNSAVARQGTEFNVAESLLAVGGQQLRLKGLSGEYSDIFLPVSGPHQAANASLALAAVEAFFGATADSQLDHAAVRAGFEQVRIPGRVERVHSEPTVLIDAAHNPHGARSLAHTLKRDFNFASVIAVISVFADKDIRAFLTELEPVVSEVVLTRNSSSRAADPFDVVDIAYEIFGDDRVRVEEHFGAAIELGMELAEEHSEDGAGVVVTGSVATAGQARAYFATHHKK